MDESDTGLKKSREKGGLLYTVKLLPVKYLVYRDAQNQLLSKSGLDSLFNMYNKTLSFVLHIQPTEERSGEDLIYHEVYSYEEYRARVEELNFGLKEYIHLSIGGEKYTPELLTFENNYGLTEGKSFYMVFVPDKKDINFSSYNIMQLTFTDVIFNAGLIHFNYNNLDKIRLPKLKINNEVF